MSELERLTAAVVGLQEKVDLLTSMAARSAAALAALVDALADQEDIGDEPAAVSLSGESIGRPRDTSKGLT